MSNTKRFINRVHWPTEGLSKLGAILSQKQHIPRRVVCLPEDMRYVQGLPAATWWASPANNNPGTGKSFIS